MLRFVYLCPYSGSALVGGNPIGTMPRLETRSNLPIVFDPLLTQQSASPRPIPSHTWSSSVAQSAEGVYVGEGTPPVPMRLAAKIRRGEFTDMGELLTEFWSTYHEEDPKQEAKPRRSMKVTDIFTWIQCFTTYISVLAPQQPWRIPELMAYMANIVRVSQDYAGLAWVRYDVAYHQQAAATGNNK